MGKFYSSYYDADMNGEIDAFEFGMMIHELEREYNEIMRPKQTSFAFVFEDDDDDDFDFDDGYDNL